MPQAWLPERRPRGHPRDRRPRSRFRKPTYRLSSRSSPASKARSSIGNESIVDLMKLLKLGQQSRRPQAVGAGTRLYRRARRLGGNEHLAAQAGHDEAGRERRQGAGQSQSIGSKANAVNRQVAKGDLTASWNSRSLPHPPRPGSRAASFPKAGRTFFFGGQIRILFNALKGSAVRPLDSARLMMQRHRP